MDEGANVAREPDADRDEQDPHGPTRIFARSLAFTINLSIKALGLLFGAVWTGTTLINDQKFLRGQVYQAHRGCLFLLFGAVALVFCFHRVDHKPLLATPHPLPGSKP